MNDESHSTSVVPKDIEIGIKYGWDWYSYHANQRIATFRFFLIVVAALSTGYIASIEKKLYLIAYLLSSMGVLIAFAFYCLDKRSGELVNDARDLLDSLESNLKVILRRRDKVNKPALDEKPGEEVFARKRTGELIRYGFWFRAIILVSGICFLMGIVATFFSAGK